MMSSTGMFKKLAVTHNLIAPTEIARDYSFGECREGTYQGIYYGGGDEARAWGIIPIEYRYYFSGAWMTIITDYVPPHVDNEMQTGINFYVQTAEAVTSFWNAKTPHRRKRLHCQTDGYLVHEDDVELAGQFKAEPGEVWALNVKAIHSVRSPLKELRVAYQLQTRLPYDEVLAILGVPDAAA